MSHTSILLGLAMTAVVYPGGDAAPIQGLESSDAIHLKLIIHNNSVFDGVPRLPGLACPQSDPR